jgi:hypothetical protein
MDLFDYILTIVIFDPRQKTALAASLEAWRIARMGWMAYTRSPSFRY